MKMRILTCSKNAFSYVSAFLQDLGCLTACFCALLESFRPCPRLCKPRLQVKQPWKKRGQLVFSMKGGSEVGSTAPVQMGLLDFLKTPGAPRRSLRKAKHTDRKSCVSIYSQFLNCGVFLLAGVVNKCFCRIRRCQILFRVQNTRKK